MKSTHRSRLSRPERSVTASSTKLSRRSNGSSAAEHGSRSLDHLAATGPGDDRIMARTRSVRMPIASRQSNPAARIRVYREVYRGVYHAGLVPPAQRTTKAPVRRADQGLALYPPWDSNPEPAD